MADPVCVKCSKPILTTQRVSTEDQVDACTMAVQRVTYHSECLDRPQGGRPMDDTATAQPAGVAQVFDLHALKDFAPDKRVRKMLFKTDQLWSEIACYEPGQSTPMHQHPLEEEAIYVLEGTATMQIDGEEIAVPAGSIVRFPNRVLHDVRNLGAERCVIMFLKVNPKVLPKVSPKV
jgi:quercetin dioxygenase-like cupin family protein